MIYCMRTRIFFSVNNTDCLLVTNYRIIEFCLHTEYRGQSRIFLFLSRIFELSNFVFTRNIADSHGFFFFFFSCPELSNFNHTEYRGRSRIFFFSSCPELSNYRILSFLSRDLSFVPNYRIFVFCDFPRFSV